MHGVIAYTGSNAERFQQLCRAAEHFGANKVDTRNIDNNWIGSFGSVNVVATFSDTTGDGVVYGSAASTVHYHSENFLDEAPDDVVGCTIHREAGLIVAASRGNHKMFVHHLSEHEMMASSSLSVLAYALRDTTSIDRSYEDFALGFGFLPGVHTVFKGIKSLPPGTRYFAATTHSETTTAFPVSVPPTTSFEQAIPQLYDLFIKAVTEQAGNRTKHAVLLGGFDSMLVAATLRKLGHEVHTYTFSFGDPNFEQRNISEFVGSLGITHHPVVITPELIEKNLRTFGSHFYQLGAQSHYQILTLIGSQQIANDGFNAISNGDGCDAIFLSFPTVNRRATISTRVANAPHLLKKLALLPLQTSLAERQLGHVGRVMRSVLNNALLPQPARGHLPTRYLDDYALSRLRIGAQPKQAERMLALRMRLAEPTAQMDAPRRAFNGNGLTAQSRVKVDGAVCTTGLPHFSPYTHPEFRAFVSSLPIEYLKNQNDSPSAKGKELLVAMVRRYDLLPDLFIEQPKQSPSDSPVDNWYMTCLKDQIMSQIKDLPFTVNTKYVNTILRKKYAEKWYRNNVSIGHHTMQAVGLLASYASFNRLLHEE
ncbi:MAG: asparagine synthase C-terminal domain-containing protein [Actinomycetes bacterium]